MKTSDRVLRVLLWASIVLFIGIYIFDPAKGIADPQIRLLTKMAILRISAIPAIVCCVLILRFKLAGRPKLRDAIFLLPALLIALNNSPWLPLAGGQATWNGTTAVWLLLLQVIGVGVMEELAFRGILLPVLLGRFGKTKKGLWLSVLLSSAIFGLIHFANLIETPNLAAVLMQVGYSTLLGALCAVLLLGTGNIWYCIVVHTVYNFGGGISAYFTQGTIWTLPNVLLTVILSVAVFGWYLYLTFRLDPARLPEFRKPKIENREGGENG